jgi:hypothetical protein
LDIEFTVDATGYIRVGFYAVSEDATYSDSLSDGGMGSMTDSFYWEFDNGFCWYGGVNQATKTVTNGDTIKIERVGSTIKFYKNGALQHTFSQTFSGAVRIVVGTATAGDMSNFRWTKPAATVNMTLVSNAVTALAQPDDAFIVLWQENGDAITLNTDLKAYASRDGGTTWNQIMLTEEATLTTGRILTGTVALTSSGTSMKYKIETLNTKDQKIHGVGLQWS